MSSVLSLVEKFSIDRLIVLKLHERVLSDVDIQKRCFDDKTSSAIVLQLMKHVSSFFLSHSRFLTCIATEYMIRPLGQVLSKTESVSLAGLLQFRIRLLLETFNTFQLALPVFPSSPRLETRSGVVLTLTFL
ncbi:hypothetical protein PGT21_006007 [Puccinia graminis f. sp. tritici]|uniref:Uncharacterized protein n=1 Tax=Puccinia graminis f. sp. tritici TaxID=56615 RepID=A0A5B0QVY1_PUCGR|nr:hypothetical protein PGTUg99_015267 [Puccinia graminis f. sp. tritici]KAA1117398.1 hypothetical protein PGT21_006007 [Puccinia graminis f. sp. tritici]